MHNNRRLSSKGKLEGIWELLSDVTVLTTPVIILAMVFICYQCLGIFLALKLGEKKDKEVTNGQIYYEGEGWGDGDKDKGQSVGHLADLPAVCF